MPTYQLAMVMSDGSKAMDHDPYECADDADAVAEAQRAAVELATDALSSGKSPWVTAVEVLSGNGEDRIATVEVAGAVNSLLQGGV